MNGATYEGTEQDTRIRLTGPRTLHQMTTEPAYFLLFIYIAPNEEVAAYTALKSAGCV